MEFILFAGNCAKTISEPVPTLGALVQGGRQPSTLLDFVNEALVLWLRLRSHGVSAESLTDSLGFGVVPHLTLHGDVLFLTPARGLYMVS